MLKVRSKELGEGACEATVRSKWPLGGACKNNACTTASRACLGSHCVRSNRDGQIYDTVLAPFGVVTSLDV